MLSIQLFRTDRKKILTGLQKKNFAQPELVDTIIGLDEEKRTIQSESDALSATINAASKEIGKLMVQGKKDEAEEVKNNIAVHKETAKNYTQQLSDIEKRLEEQLLLLPNLPHESVPKGKTPEDNEIVRQFGDIPNLSNQKKPHWELAAQYGLIDFELGNKITGSGFPVYIHQGAKLQRTLISYFLDYNTQAGYREYYPPYLVNENSAYGTGQLPDKEGQMYHIQDDHYFLIPTAEVPVTNVYRDEIIKKLPVKMTAYTPCFRREAGSYGKEVRGLNRVHQFDKVEIVQITHPDKSYEVLEEMVAHVEKLIQSLALPYRILRLCGGDMSFASALTYDFEVYSAAQERWLEVSSVSNFETFQTNRMKIRFKDENGKTQLAHSLNGSALALPRIMACILENNQTPEGILLPKPLHSFFGKEIIQ